MAGFNGTAGASGRMDSIRSSGEGDRELPASQRRQIIQEIRSNLNSGEYDSADEMFSKAAIALKQYIRWASSRSEFDSDSGMVMDSGEQGSALLGAIEEMADSVEAALDPDEIGAAARDLSMSRSHGDMADVAGNVLEAVREVRYDDDEDTEAGIACVSADNAADLDAAMEGLLGDLDGDIEGIDLTADEEDGFIGCLLYASED